MMYIKNANGYSGYGIDKIRLKSYKWCEVNDIVS